MLENNLKQCFHITLYSSTFQYNISISHTSLRTHVLVYKLEVKKYTLHVIVKERKNSNSNSNIVLHFKVIDPRPAHE